MTGTRHTVQECGHSIGNYTIHQSLGRGGASLFFCEFKFYCCMSLFILSKTFLYYFVVYKALHSNFLYCQFFLIMFPTVACHCCKFFTWTYTCMYILVVTFTASEEQEWRDRGIVESCVHVHLMPLWTMNGNFLHIWCGMQEINILCSQCSYTYANSSIPIFIPIYIQLAVLYVYDAGHHLWRPWARCTMCTN